MLSMSSFHPNGCVHHQPGVNITLRTRKEMLAELCKTGPSPYTPSPASCDAVADAVAAVVEHGSWEQWEAESDAFGNYIVAGE